MKIYVSLPITGRDYTKTREHADIVKAMLSRSGHEAVTPFDIFAGDNPTYLDYILYDLRVLGGCDAIFLCEEWQFSKGCRIERTFAEEMGKQVMYERQNDSQSEYYFNR